MIVLLIMCSGIHPDNYHWQTFLQVGFGEKIFAYSFILFIVLEFDSMHVDLFC